MEVFEKSEIDQFHKFFMNRLADFYEISYQKVSEALALTDYYKNLTTTYEITHTLGEFDILENMSVYLRKVLNLPNFENQFKERYRPNS